MAETIYGKIGKSVGKDVRLVRAVAHHPFEFFAKVMADKDDHRPMRFRYLGAFAVKPYWHKGLRNSKKIGLPEDGTHIWARVPVDSENKKKAKLKEGNIKGGRFISSDCMIECPVEDVQFWTS